jgi:hypothetical protein
MAQLQQAQLPLAQPLLERIITANRGAVIILILRATKPDQRKECPCRRVGQGFSRTEVSCGQRNRSSNS